MKLFDEIKALYQRISINGEDSTPTTGRHLLFSCHIPPL